MAQLGASWFPGRRPLRRAFLLCGIIAAVACDRAPFTAPSGSAITLVASTTRLTLNGVAEITAFVIEGAQGVGTPDEPGDIVAGSGTPVHDGTEVYFTTSLGRIEPAEARTSGGRAQARLVGDGRSGTAIVTAISGAAVSSIEVDIGAALATRIVVTANPQSLPSGGGTARILARVEDQQGNGVGGILVSFSTSRGSLNDTSAVTDGDGYAETTLSTTAESTVTATSGGAATALSGNVVVTIR